jgi:iron complex outermembrane recepter protein
LNWFYRLTFGSVTRRLSRGKSSRFGAESFFQQVPVFAVLVVFLIHTCFADTPDAAPGDDSLKQLSLAELGNVEVTTVSKEPEKLWKTPAAAYVLTQEDIRRSGATSIPEALRLVPGVEVAQVDSSHWSVSIRGFGAVLASKILVLIDGRSVYTPLYAGVYWQVQAVPMEDIDRIEVIRGPGGTIWGANAFDGIINIITKKATDTHGVMVATGGGNVNQGTADLHYGGGTSSGLNYRIYGMGFTNGPEFHPDGTNFDDWRMGQAGFRTDWDFDPRDTFTFQGDIYHEIAGEATTYALYSPPSQVAVDGNAQLSGGNLVARWKHVVNDGSDYQIQAYFDRTNHFEPEFGETRNTFDVDFLDHLTLPGQENFLWGVGVRESPSNLIQRVPTIFFTPAQLTDQIYSAFVQDEIPLGHQVSLTAGTKLEHNNYTGFEVQPTGRVLWNRTPKQTFWGSVTRAVRTPSRLDTDIELTDFAAATPFPIYLRVNGNPQFHSEELIAYEAGYRTAVASRLYLDVAVFYNDYNDIYSFQVGTPFFELTPSPPHAVIPVLTSNGIRGFGGGFEAGPDWKPLNWWELKTSYSYLDLNLENKPGSNDPTSVSIYEGSTPHNQIVLQSRVNLPKRLEFDQTLRYVTALGAQLVPSYETADVRFGWHLTREAEFSVSGQNLLQPHFEQFAGDPGGPVEIKRSVYGKLTWQVGGN